VALFLAALITLTGCPTSVDDSDSGTLYAHRIYGRNVDPYTAQQAIDNAVAAGEPIVLEDGLSISPAGHLNFKGARLLINGAVQFNGGVMSVVGASVTWADGSSLDLSPGVGNGGTGAYIYPGDVPPPVAQDALVEYEESLYQIMATATHAAVSRFTLGPIRDNDYSTGTGIPAKVSDRELTTLYVLDELIMPYDSTTPDITLTALGAVDVTGALSTGVVVVGSPTLSLGTCSTLTSSKGGITIPVQLTNGITTIPNIKVEEGRDFTIVQSGGVGNLVIDGKLTGRGTLVAQGAITNIAVNRGGDGSITFSGNVTPRKVEITSSGTVTFNGTVGPLNVESSIAGDVVFMDDVTAAAALTLNGNVTLVSNAAGASVLSVTDGPLTLGAGKTISTAITPRPAGSVATLAPMLKAVGTVVLTPVGGAAVLTPADPPTKSDEATVNAAKDIGLSGALEITRGTLQVEPGATLDINGVTLTTGITPARVGYLAVADGGTLAFWGGTLDIGDTTINMGGAAASAMLTAVGGTVTLGNDKIAGSVPGAKLEPPAKGGTSGSAPAIALNGGGTGRLILEQVDLNLATFGVLAIVNMRDQVILAKQARITLNNTEGGIPTEWGFITLSGGANSSAILNGGFVGLTAPGSTTKQSVWSVAHRGGDAPDAGITATVVGGVRLGKTPAATFTIR
jgi:hypothetical protein